MALRGSSISGARLATISAVTAAAILLGANLAHSQAVTIPAANQLLRPAHPVADGNHERAPASFADLAEKVEPAVIGVTSIASAPRKALPDWPFGPGRRRPGKQEAPGTVGSDSSKVPDAPETIAIGSGFFISPDGYAVTNSHVVEGNDAIEIRTSDNRHFAARLVGSDSLSDLALIKVDGRTDFSYVKLADRPPRVGDWILAVGSPFGLGGTVTAGIVSAREREIDGGPGDGFIQLDAPINRGDSGGPSFNTDGDVIGVNSKILSPSGGYSGIAFAIPADTVKAVIPQLREKGTVTRGSMGAAVQSVTPEIADGLGMNNLRGAIVASVQDNGPAAKAGIRRGDVITSVGGAPIKSANDLTRKIRAQAPGSSVRLAMVRKGKESSLNVTVVQLANHPRPSPAHPR